MKIMFVFLFQNKPNMQSIIAEKRCHFIYRKMKLSVKTEAVFKHKHPA